MPSPLPPAAAKSYIEQSADRFFYSNPDKLMDSPIVKVDDKFVPLYRIVWASDIPHFCGEPDCMHEGDYEIRLDVDDSLWTNAIERDEVVQALTRWCSDPRGEERGEEPGW